MKKVWIWSLLLLGLIVLSFILGVNLGYAKIPVQDVLSIIQTKVGLGGRSQVRILSPQPLFLGSLGNGVLVGDIDSQGAENLP